MTGALGVRFSTVENEYFSTENILKLNLPRTYLFFKLLRTQEFLFN